MELGEKHRYILFTLYAHIKKSKTQMWGRTLRIEFIYNFHIKYFQIFKWEAETCFSVHNILLYSFMT